MPTVGSGLTEMAVVAVDAPQAFDPVTVYPEETVGKNWIPFVTALAPFQVYEFAPAAVSVADFPGQTVGEGLAIVITGGAVTTDTVIAAFVRHPSGVIPLSV
jgi:hypothetical protein